MSSEPTDDKSEPTAEGEPAEGSDAAQKTERVDEEGLPLDREATIDDVRLGTGLHGRYALGCTLLIILCIVAFWLIRSAMG